MIDCRDLRPAPGTGRAALRPRGYSGASATARYSSMAMRAPFFQGQSLRNVRPQLSAVLYTGVAEMVSPDLERREKWGK